MPLTYSHNFSYLKTFIFFIPIYISHIKSKNSLIHPNTFWIIIQKLFNILQYTYKITCYDEHVMMIEHLNLAQ